MDRLRAPASTKRSASSTSLDRGTLSKQHRTLSTSSVDTDTMLNPVTRKGFYDHNFMNFKMYIKDKSGFIKLNII
jgi:hypothetical protein